MRQVPRLDFVDGESLRFLGRDLLIRGLSTQGRARVGLLAAEGRVELWTREGSDREARARLVDAWYRAELGKLLPGLIATWEARLGVRVAAWGFRRMRSRWGSCNPATARISLNLELATRPEACLEYVLVHEMAHLLEPGHGPAFKAVMDGALPDWRRVKKLLAEEALPRI